MKSMRLTTMLCDNLFAFIHVYTPFLIGYLISSYKFEPEHMLHCILVC